MDLLVDVVSFLKTLVASILLYYRAWRSSASECTESLAVYHDLGALDATTTPLSAQEDSPATHSDDLECGLLSPPLICVSPATHFPVQFDGEVVSLPSSPTLSNSSIAPITPVLTSHILSHYLSQGSGISLSESAQALLFSQYRAPNVAPSVPSVSRAALLDVDVEASQSPVRFVENPDDALQSTGHLVKRLSTAMGAVSNPWSQGSSSALHPQSSINIDCEVERAVSLIQTTTAIPPCDGDCNLEVSPAEPVHIKGADPTAVKATQEHAVRRQRGLSVARRRPPSVLRHSPMYPHIPGALAAPLPHHLTAFIQKPPFSLDEEPIGKAPVSVDAPQEKPLDDLTLQETTGSITYPQLTASFISLPEGVNSLQTAVHNNDESWLPSSFSSPEPHYYGFYYEHYCQDPGPASDLPETHYLVDTASSGDISQVGISTSDTASNPILLPVTSSISPWLIFPSMNANLGTPLSSLFVFPSCPFAAEDESEVATAAALSDSGSEVGRDRDRDEDEDEDEDLGRHLSASNSSASSASGDESESSLVLSRDTTLLQAKRASISKPIFLLRVPGTRESVVVLPEVSNAVAYLTPGRIWSGMNGTRASNWATGSGIGGTSMSCVESLSDLPYTENSSTSLKVVEDRKVDANPSDDETEIDWLVWPPGIPEDSESLSISPIPPPPPPPSPPRTMTVFNNNHRKPYINPSVQPALVQDPTLQSNRHQLVVSNIPDLHRPVKDYPSMLHSSIIMQTNNAVTNDVPQLTFSEGA